MEAIDEVDHFTYLDSVVDTQDGTEADVKVRIGKGGLSSNEEYLEIQCPFAEKQYQDFQYKCQGCSPLRSRDMEDHVYNKWDKHICQQMRENNLWYLVA